MAKNQKYYYMRLRADFFSRKDIILLESMPNGAVYCLILLKLLTASLENNGHLMLNEEIVMTPAMLATITRYDVGTVEKALQIFMQLGLVEQLPDSSYFMMELEGMVGKTSTEADRKRITRANVKALKEQEADKCLPNVQALSENRPPEILSFDEPTRFIFSHSALREGWDNPNVFQICTLKHSDSNTAKRQEVGRGLRLCVNQNGNRMDVESCGEAVHDINTLTVVASESYKSFVTDLQSDIKTVLYDRPTVPSQKK